MSFEESYLVSSAEYCELMFEVSHLFFLANVDVERNAKRRILSEPQRFEFKLSFATLALRMRELVLAFDQYAKVHLSQSPEDAARFEQQGDRLRKLEGASVRLSEKADLLDEGRLLQEQLWDDDGYTDVFTECALLICRAVEWQSLLARETNLGEDLPA